MYQVEAIIHFEDDTEELQQWDQQVIPCFGSSLTTGPNISTNYFVHAVSSIELLPAQTIILNQLGYAYINKISCKKKL